MSNLQLDIFFQPASQRGICYIDEYFYYCRKGPGDSLREKNIFPIGGGAEIRFSQTTSTRIHKYAPNLSHFYAVQFLLNLFQEKGHELKLWIWIYH